MPELQAKIAILGSGELAPSMVKIHRLMLKGLGSAHPVFIDSTFGFQENANELTEKAQEYFRNHYQSKLSVASLRQEIDATPSNLARYRTELSQSNYIFAGPGSPSYALKMFHLANLDKLLEPRLYDPIVLCFASAASTTLGEFALPVYEIYKAGHDPYWLEGINIFAHLGIRVAIVPHYDNHEGATHDTRFCYIGERRLRQLEETLPPDASILGVDEHTAAVVDTATRTVSVAGRAAVTIRLAGEEVAFHDGESFQLDELLPRQNHIPPAKMPERERSVNNDSPLRTRNAKDTVDTLLNLLEEGDTEKLTAYLIELEEPLTQGFRDQSEIISPLMKVLMDLRDRARAEKNFVLSDEIRDELTAIGFAVLDSPEGSQWKQESTL